MRRRCELRPTIARGSKLPDSSGWRRAFLLECIRPMPSPVPVGTTEGYRNSTSKGGENACQVDVLTSAGRRPRLSPSLCLFPYIYRPVLSTNGGLETEQRQADGKIGLFSPLKSCTSFARTSITPVAAEQQLGPLR